MLCCIPSIQADGSTDSAIIEDELYLSSLFQPLCCYRKVPVCNNFLLCEYQRLEMLKVCLNVLSEH